MSTQFLHKQWKQESPVGNLYLVGSNQGLAGIYWERQEIPMALSLTGSGPEIKILAQAVKQLKEYFQGKRRDFDLKLDAAGTAFQESVWSELRKIPYGKTCSYGEVAARIQNPKAVRAVGTANGRNPLSIIVPCHRVIAAGGKMGGYAGGLKIKAQLLDLERKNGLRSRA